MSGSAAVRRVVVVILDGLRADAVSLFPLPRLRQAAALGAWTTSARTVTPSVTSAAITSLVTGASPAEHGVATSRFGWPVPRPGVRPLPALLRGRGFPVSGHFAAIPPLWRGFATRFVRRLGGEVAFAGNDADEILGHAGDALDRQRDGLIMMHWPDGDRAGHAHGWGTPAYQAAARTMDAAFGRLLDRTGAVEDDGTVVIALADHGGGGSVDRDHDSAHPLDNTIPLILCGGAVHRGELRRDVSLLDVPATIAWLLDVPAPGYAGRPLAEAFRRHSDHLDRAA